jgi:DNA-binding beta-propeller fold protein YncE
MNEVNKHALIVACDRYSDPELKQLQAPSQDAETFQRILENPKIGGFKVTALINQPHWTITEKINEFLQSCNRGDTVLLYFSCHGIKDRDGRLYFATITTNRKLLLATGIQSNFVTDVLDHCRAQQKVVLLDCCYSGAFEKGRISKDDRQINATEKFGRGNVVITSSDEMQYAFEGDKIDNLRKGSYFTSALIEGLETGKADVNNDGKITYSELYDYVYDYVRKITPDQTPTLNTRGVEGNFVVFKNPKETINHPDLHGERHGYGEPSAPTPTPTPTSTPVQEPQPPHPEPRKLKWPLIMAVSGVAVIALVLLFSFYLPSSNNIPRVEATQSNVTKEDKPIPVTLSATDTDNDALTFSMLTQPSHGSLSGTSPNLVYTPYENYVGDDSFTYQASDGKANSDVGTVTIRVDGVNDSPVANAGADQIALSGDEVTLNSVSSTDTDGRISAYSWEQTKGPLVINLTGVNSSSPTFVAPSVTSDTNLEFALVVKDDAGNSSLPNPVSVAVKSALLPPTIPVRNYSLVAQWGSVGTAEGQFHAPQAISIDSKDNVYVADTGNNRIQVFQVLSSNGTYGTFLRGWGGFGTDNGFFNQPRGIAVDQGGNVYVADTGNNRIQVFFSNGTFMRGWGTEGTFSGFFSHPEGTAVNPLSGNVYVADTGNNRIQVFSSNGIAQSEWGGFGTDNGFFNQPRGIAVDQGGNVYVADTGNNRIQVFSSNGTFITKWGSQGTADRQFSNPLRIAIDSLNNVYVVDSGNNRIQKFSGVGQFNVKWGSQGSGDREFANLADITVDISSNVYVLDRGNNRIQAWAATSGNQTTNGSSLDQIAGPLEGLFGGGNQTTSGNQTALEGLFGGGNQTTNGSSPDQIAGPLEGLFGGD